MFLTAWTAIDQEVVAKLTELDMLVSDLEQANSRVATVERRNVRFYVRVVATFLISEMHDRNSCGLRLNQSRAEMTVMIGRKFP